MWEETFGPPCIWEWWRLILASDQTSWVLKAFEDLIMGEFNILKFYWRFIMGRKHYLREIYLFESIS